MRSTNPVFARTEQFHGQPQAYQTPAGYPGSDQLGAYGSPTPGAQRPAGLMTLDDVITKTAITMGVLFLTAALAYMFIPLALVSMTTIVAAIAGFVTVMMVAFRRQINPAMVLVYSAIEGVFVGGLSKIFEAYYPGIVVPAVFATFIAAGATLLAYRFFNIRVTTQFRRIVTYSTFALAGLALVNLVFALFGVNFGLVSVTGPVSVWAWLFSIVALVLAVANLVMDFDYVEQGVRNRLPASESWRAAFGLTVTMVWLYTEILRIMSYFRR